MCLIGKHPTNCVTFPALVFYYFETESHCTAQPSFELMVILLPSLLSTGIACVDHHASLVSLYMVLLFTVCGVFLESDGDEAHSRNCWGSDLVHCFLPNSLPTVQEDSQCPPSSMTGQGQKSALPGQVSEKCPWPELPTLCIIRMPYWPRAWP